MHISHPELIDFAQDWSVRLQQRSAEIETARRLPADIARAFADGGVFHALVPDAFGGSQVHPSTLVELIKQIAIGDGSAGWNVMIGTTTGLLAASLPEAFARQIYGGGPGMLSVGVTAPLGRAELIDGQYRVTGRWPFGSGSENADWICGGCFVFEEGEQQLDDRGAPVIHLIMFARDQVHIEDTWQVSGLRGTGSHHFHVDDVSVPLGRSVILGGRSRIKAPLYQFPMLGLLALGVSSVSLGIGYRALAAFKALASAKVPTGGNRSLSERSQTQSIVARATADLESSEAYMHSVIDQAWEIAERGERLTAPMKARLRLAAANTTHRAVAAVDSLYEAGGGSAIYETSDLQRCFRDVHVTTQHIMVAQPIFEVIGRVELGLPAKSLL